MSEEERPLEQTGQPSTKDWIRLSQSVRAVQKAQAYQTPTMVVQGMMIAALVFWVVLR